MSDKDRNRAISRLLKYLRRDFFGHDMHHFEREMEADPFTRDAIDGYRELTPDEAKQDLYALQISITKRIKRRRRTTIYSVAASLAALMIVSTLFIKLSDFSQEKAAEKVSESFMEKESKVASPNEDEDKEDDGDTGISAMESEATPGLNREKGEDRNAKGAREKEDSENIQETKVNEVTVYEAEPMAAKQDKAEAEARSRSTQSGFKKTADDQTNEKGEIEMLTAEKATQNRKYIDGVIISSEDSMPIPGASVLLKGTTQGVLTDSEGYFNLEVSGDDNPTLVANFIGMESEEITVTDDQSLTVAMNPDMMGLDEVVVVGQETTRQVSSKVGAIEAVENSDRSGASGYAAPLPKGGNKSFKSYIDEHIKFPEDISDTDRSVVILRFTVLTSGDISDIQVLRSADEAFSTEAKRLLNEGPGWEPAKRDGVLIKDQVRLRIVFERTP